jgi:glycosyltransferase involved in cell wall biosynthesis
MKSIAISIPAYNDSVTIGELVKNSVEVLSGITPDYEIIVIDDGSGDNTLEIALKLSKENPKIRVFNHEKNEGFGKTIKEVFTFPQKEWVFFIPGDGQVSPEEIKKLLPFSDNADFILGNRSTRSDPFIRHFNSAVYNLLISIGAGKRVKDVNSVVLFKKEIMKNLKLKGESAFIHAEIFLKVARSGYKIAYTDIEHKPRTSGKGSGNKISIIIPTVINLFKYLFCKRGN